MVTYFVFMQLTQVLSQYIGNQARHQLVKNSQNTITGFRNLLGKKCVVW
jgi:molecular chaperone DnaK (HSP70)